MKKTKFLNFFFTLLFFCALISVLFSCEKEIENEADDDIVMQILALEDEVQDLKDKYQAKLTELSEEKRKNDEAIAKLKSDYNSKTSELEQAIKEKSDTLASIEQRYSEEIVKFGAENEKIVAELTAKYNLEKQALLDENCGKEEEIEKLKSEYDTAIAQFEAKNAENEEILSKLSDDYEELLSKFTAEHNKTAELLLQIDQLNAKLDEILVSQPEKEEPVEKILYSFGVLSDIHVKNSQRDSDTVDTKQNYIRALEFYEQNSADFICVAGDVIWNGSKGVPELEESRQYWVEEVQLFKSLNDEYFENPIYATTGNHDATLRGYAHGAYGMQEIATYYGDGTKSAAEAWEEIVGTPLNYVIEREDDVFIFLGMYYWNYTTFYRMADEAWLKEQLEAYKDRRVFLFFHPFLQETFDNTLNCEGVPAGKTAGSASRFEPLVNQYDNVIWFSGHSHIDAGYEGKYDFENPNVYQSGSSMTMIHVPACAFLRCINSSGTSYSRVYGTSQGLWVDVYADKIVVKAINFSAENGGAFVPKATYIINTK